MPLCLFSFAKIYLILQDLHGGGVAKWFDLLANFESGGPYSIPHCAGPEKIHTPPTEGIRISSGENGSVRPRKFF